MQKLLLALQERLQDLKLIHEYFLEEGENAIVEILPPIKYFLGTVIDILNDGLGGFWGDITRPNFYAVFGPLMTDQQLRGLMQLAQDDFDRGAIWLIERLNRSELSVALQMFAQDRKLYEKKYSKKALLMDEEATKELIAMIAKMESEIRFDLHPEDLHVMRVRMTPRLSPLNSPLESPETGDASVQLQNLPSPATPRPGFFTRMLAKTASFSDHFKRQSEVHRATLTSSNLDEEEFEFIEIESVSVIPSTKASLLDMKICPERGLDAQNYSCVGCQNGIGASDAVKCDFSGEYYCKTCHGGWEGINPVRLLRNWDTKRYPISSASRRILAQLDYSELIDFASTNPKIFKSVEAFSYIGSLRKEIVKMAKKRLDKIPARDRKLQKSRMEALAWPKTHLLTSAKLYTIEDLTEVAEGTFYTRVLLPLYNALKI